MRILIDITHPAHLHFFAGAVRRLRRDGHEVLLTARHKDVLIDLAARMGFELDEVFGGAPSGTLGLAKTLLSRQLRLARIARRFKPEVTGAIGGTFIGFVSWTLRIPTVVFSDTESAHLSNAITYPFATRLVTPRVYGRPDRRGQVRYDGYHENAYLLPSVFTPDPAVRQELGVADSERYCVVRFVGWAAGHDIGRTGLSVAGQKDMVRRLSEHGRVFVSSEGQMPEEIEHLRFSLPVDRMHHALGHASLIVGESSTMSHEAAVMGVPSVYLYPRVQLGPTTDLSERLGIVHWFAPEELDAAVDCAVDIFAGGDTERWRAIGRTIAEESADITEVICDQLLSAGRGEALQRSTSAGT